MAELFLKFEDRVLQELLLSGGTATIGRQPDNIFCVEILPCPAIMPGSMRKAITM